MFQVDSIAQLKEKGVIIQGKYKHEEIDIYVRITEDCMIHIDNIDEEHRKLFQMLNEAFALVKETDNAASIAKNLIDILRIMLLHILLMKKNT